MVESHDIKVTKFKFKHLRSQRLSRRGYTPRRIARVIRVNHPVQSVRINHPIFGDYGNFLNSFNQTNMPASENHPYVPMYIFDKFNVGKERNEAIAAYYEDLPTIEHKQSNELTQEKLIHLIFQISARASRATAALLRDYGRNTGAANKRRKRAINQFKQAKSDFNLLTSSIRNAISSTMRERNQITKESLSEVRVTYTVYNGKLYESESLTPQYYRNMVSLVNILNVDIEILYQAYKLMSINLYKFNSIIGDFNVINHD